MYAGSPLAAHCRSRPQLRFLASVILAVLLGGGRAAFGMAPTEGFRTSGYRDDLRGPSDPPTFFVNVLASDADLLPLGEGASQRCSLREMGGHRPSSYRPETLGRCV